MNTAPLSSFAAFASSPSSAEQATAPGPHRHMAPPLAPYLVVAMAAWGVPVAAWAQTPAAGGTSVEAPADPAAPVVELDKVEIRARRPNDTELRRQSTAAKTVIGRAEIERMGDSTLGEVLQRLPGLSVSNAPGRGGTVRMRGLGSGYTQILIDGERVPKGLALESIPPDQVERIEILRAPTAETGAQAIAGTVNIVLREAVSQRQAQTRLTLEHDSDHWQPSLSGSYSNRFGPLSVQITADAAHQDTRRTNHTEVSRETAADADETLVPAFGQRESSLSHQRSDRLHLGSRLSWKASATDTFTLAPFLVLSRHDNHTTVGRDTWLGTDDSGAAFASADSRGDATYRLARLNGGWQTRWGQGGKAEVKLGGRSSVYRGETQRVERNAAGGELRREQDLPDTRDRGWQASTKISQVLPGRGEQMHEWATGVEVESSRRQDQRSRTQWAPDGTASALSTGFGDDLEAQVHRAALWAQDDWSLDPQWSLQAGLRWEGIRTRSTSSALSASHLSSVTTPLLHLLWRPENRRKDQVRLSLTRSYLPPSLNNLTARRSLSSSYPVGVDGTGTNVPTSPDYTGNPDLRPELATGVDLALEHYLAQGGLWSVSFFHRRITDLMRGVVSQQTVDWASVPRWVSRPENIGTARTTGLELEGKFKWRELQPSAPAVDVRASASVYRSRVDALSGPDNRLDDQPDWTLKLGADHSPAGWPLTWGAGLSWTSDYAIQHSAIRHEDVAGDRQIDLHTTWTPRPGLKWRLTGRRLLPHDARTLVRTDAVNATTGERTLSTTSTRVPGQTVWGVQLEIRM